jgi:hypothetical protein
MPNVIMFSRICIEYFLLIYKLLLAVLTKIARFRLKMLFRIHKLQSTFEATTNVRVGCAIYSG